MENFEGYEIYFKHRNALMFKKDGRLINMIALPPCINGCDIINIFKEKINLYTFNYKGFILMTTEKERTLYYKEQIIAKFISE